jgi:hypothetical protein
MILYFLKLPLLAGEVFKIKKLENNSPAKSIVLISAYKHHHWGK